MELGIVELLQHLGQDVVEGVYAHRVMQTVEGLGGRCPDLDKETNRYVLVATMIRSINFRK